LAAGIVVDHFGYSTAFLSAGAAAFVAAMILIVALRDRTKAGKGCIQRWRLAANRQEISALNDGGGWRRRRVKPKHAVGTSQL
jgi:hypothetical protein